jgi:hypothetical protein
MAPLAPLAPLAPWDHGVHWHHGTTGTMGTTANHGTTGFASLLHEGRRRLALRMSRQMAPVTLETFGCQIFVMNLTCFDKT